MPLPPKKTGAGRDLDGDGDIDLADDPARDLDRDGRIDAEDREQLDLDNDQDIDAADRELKAKQSVGDSLGLSKTGEGWQKAEQAQAVTSSPKVK